MFKKTLLKVLVVLLMVVTTVSVIVIPASGATEYVTYRAGANGISSAYKNTKFHKQLEQVPITGNDITNTMAVALSQLGYLEGKRDGDFDGKPDSGYYGRNFTEMNWNMGNFGVGYGGSYEWCACFVSFCLYQGHATDQNKMSDWCRNHTSDPNYVWREVSCTRWINNLKLLSGNYGFRKSKTDGGTYTPKAGDQIYFYRGNSAGHIGLVAYTDDKYVYTIEGNTNPNFGVVEGDGNGVYFKKYALGNSSLYGYGILPYENTASADVIDYSGKNPSPGVYVSAHDDGKGIYTDADFSSLITTVPIFGQVEVLEVVKKHSISTNNSDNNEILSTLKVKYNGKIGYMKDTEGSRLIQITKTGHSHDFSVESTDAKYLINEANCIAPTTYAKSCACGEASSTETFTVGTTKADNHASTEFKYTKNDDNTHTKMHACCEVVVDTKESCKYGNPMYNDSFHLNKCSLCHKLSEREEHSGTPGCTTPAKCSCGYEWGEPAGHKFTVTKFDATRHWNKCANCDEIDTTSLHSFDENGKCECGATQDGEIIPEIIIPTIDDFEFDTQGKLPTQAELVVNNIDTKSEHGAILLNMVSEFGYNQDKGVVIMDIHATDAGEKVQPNGAIRVTVNKPISNVDNYVIYHIKDNGSIEIINTTSTEDGKLSFNVSSFSSFVFAESADPIIGNGNALSDILTVLITIASVLAVELILFIFVKIAFRKKS